jgi:hypothetical protein
MTKKAVLLLVTIAVTFAVLALPSAGLATPSSHSVSFAYQGDTVSVRLAASASGDRLNARLLVGVHYPEGAAGDVLLAVSSSPGGAAAIGALRATHAVGSAYGAFRVSADDGGHVDYDCQWNSGAE